MSQPANDNDGIDYKAMTTFALIRLFWNTSDDDIAFRCHTELNARGEGRHCAV